MDELKVLKVASEPVGALPNAVYFIKKVGQTGFDIKVSNHRGDILFPMNCCADAQGGSGGTGTTRPYKSYTAILTQQGPEPPMVVEEMENELGTDISYSYLGPTLGVARSARRRPADSPAHTSLGSAPSR